MVAKTLFNLGNRSIECGHVRFVCLVVSRIPLHTTRNEISIFSCNHNVVYNEVELDVINLTSM